MNIMSFRGRMLALAAASAVAAASAAVAAAHTSSPSPPKPIPQCSPAPPKVGPRPVRQQGRGPRLDGIQILRSQRALVEHYCVTLSDTQVLIERLAAKVLDRPVRDALIALLPIFELKEVQDMATIQEALADLDTAVKGVAQRAADDHANLQAQIDALKAQGVDTAALQAAADSIETGVAALNAIDVPVPSDPSAPVQDPTPPADGGDTPPADSGSTTPPADGGSTDPGAPVDTTPPSDPADPTTTAPASGDTSAPADPASPPADPANTAG